MGAMEELYLEDVQRTGLGNSSWAGLAMPMETFHPHVNESHSNMEDLLQPK